MTLSVRNTLLSIDTYQSDIADLGDILPFVDSQTASKMFDEAVETYYSKRVNSLTNSRIIRKYFYTDFLWGLIFGVKFLQKDVCILIKVRNDIKKIFGNKSYAVKLLKNSYLQLPILRAEDEWMFLEIDYIIDDLTGTNFYEGTYQRYLTWCRESVYSRNTYLFQPISKILRLKHYCDFIQLHKDNSNLYWGLFRSHNYSRASKLYQHYKKHFGMNTVNYLFENKKYSSSDLTLFCLVEMAINEEDFSFAKNMVNQIKRNCTTAYPNFIFTSNEVKNRLQLSKTSIWLDSCVDTCVAIFKYWQATGDDAYNKWLLEMIDGIKIFQKDGVWYKVYDYHNQCHFAPAKIKVISLMKKLEIIRPLILKEAYFLSAEETFALDDR